MQSFDGKVALVTGAGRGIGKAVALSLAQLGCRVVLAARTSGELEKVKLDIQNDKGLAIAVPTDLTRDEDIDTLVRESERQFGAVDFLINNAGCVNALVQRASVTPASKVEGAVINIGSVSGKSGEANGAAYSASKFGLIGFTQSLYEEVRQHGVKVSVILPGFVDTPLIPPNRQLDRSKMIQPADIAQAVLYVLTSSATCCPVEITVRPQQSPYR